MKIFVATLLCLLSFAPAWAQGPARPRLVPGGGWDSSSWGESRSEALAIGGFSLGAVSAAAGMPGFSADKPRSVGGYASYSVDWLRFSSSLRSSSFGSITDFSAVQSLSALGLGEGLASLSLGHQWAQIGGFSVNPAQPISESDLGGASDWSLTLAVTRDVTPAFSLGGFAAAGRSDENVGKGEAGVHFGAGLELKF